MQLASSTIKKTTLELGGKSPNIVFEDADMDQAVDGALWATFFHQGQVCESGTRLLLPESIHDEFVERLVERAKQIKVGDSSDYESDMGPLVSEAQRETVENYVRIGKEEGAKLVLGGKRPEGDGFERGYWYEPTIFTEVENSMTIAQEEIFGPVLSVIKFKDDDDAIRIANDSIYGLASGVWSQDPDRCLETAKRLKAGTVWINDFHLLNCIAPFGGYKQSGIGRELGTYGLNEYTQVKHIHWDLGTPATQKLFGVLIGTWRLAREAGARDSHDFRFGERSSPPCSGPCTSPAVSFGRQLRAIGPLPAVATLVVPALVLALDGIELGWGLPSPLDMLAVVAGCALIGCGLLLMYRTISLFARVGEGTLAPWDPTRRLVVRGPYRHVRNPMISGVFCILLGEASVFGSLPLLLWAALFITANALWMPLVEEPGLVRRFGDDYVEYKRNVPRWVPQPEPWEP